MDIFEKIKHIELNFFQTIAVTGLIVSLVAQAGLFLVNKHVDTFWAVYVVWLLVLTLASLIKVEDDHHHH